LAKDVPIFEAASSVTQNDSGAEIRAPASVGRTAARRTFGGTMRVKFWRYGKDHCVTERKPTADELAGMAWWNTMSERERTSVMQLAKANTVAEAWNWQKLRLREANDDETEH
jgi:hypothetical protein